jgi:hypothetical protein
MKSFFFKCNRSENKQFVFFNILAFSIVILLLFGQVNSTTVGLGKHELKDGKVTLAEGSRIGTVKNFEQYKKNPDACDLMFDVDGNLYVIFIVHLICFKF